MKKLGVVITDGVGFRNFVMSNFINEATTQFESVIIYSGLPKSAYQSIDYKNVIIKELEVFNEGKLTWFFRKWKEVAHMQKHRSFYGMKDNLDFGYPKNNSARSILTKIIYFGTGLVHSNKSILFAEKLQFLSFSRNKTAKSYLHLLQNDRPDHLFFSHQRPPYLAPILHAASVAKIPTSTFIFSWDNLPSKGRMLGTFDFFLVWSDLMKEELSYFYPNIKKEAIKIVGTPQFEPYVISKYETKREDFYKKFGLDSNKKTICFSCADISIGANDPIVITAIANAIANKSIYADCQLIVRTSPAEDEKRFMSVMNKFPEIVWNVPKWILTRDNHVESWSQRIPTEEDIKDLRSLLEYTDLNINMCSTMSLDYMLFDKPVINTVFGNKENGLYDDQRFLNYSHLKRVIDSEAVTVAKNEASLIQQINMALEHPDAKSAERKGMIKTQISKPLLHTSRRIAKTLSEFNA